MVGPQDAGAVGEVLLVQGYGLLESSRLLEGTSEIVTEGESTGVVGAQDAFGVLKILLV